MTNMVSTPAMMFGSLDVFQPDRFDMRAIARYVEPISPRTLGAEAVTIFKRDSRITAIPVFEEYSAVGLLTRNSVFLNFARQYGHAVYAKRPVAKLMHRAPFIVDASTPLDELRRRLLDEAPQAVEDGFIIMDRERYIGIGTSMGILRLGMVQAETRNRELFEAKKVAEQANAAKSKFLANISHELRTPLNAIIGFSEMIGKEVMGPVTPVYRGYADDINGSGRHLLEIINDILDMAKIESGQFKVTIGDVNLVEVALPVSRLLGELAARAGVHLIIDVPDDLPKLRADSRAIRQILLNLMTNAIKFSRLDGVVRLIAWAEANHVEIVIEDEGVGIPAEQIDSVLKPFVQVGDEMTRKEQGTGLGLPIVVSLAEQQGASFVLGSELGIGTRASLRFPIVSEDQAAAGIL